MYHLPEESKEFDRHPETGMGYHIFKGNINIDNGRSDYLCLNGRFVFKFSSHEDLDKINELIGSYNRDEYEDLSTYLSEETKALDPSKVKGISVLQPNSGSINLYNGKPILSQFSSVAVPTLYIRFSAFKNDKRITNNGDFLKGTYAIPYSEARMIPSGYSAVGRLALPNPASAKYMFPIVTKTPPNYIGTAVPNFGQAGGGVEVLFQNGATNLPGEAYQIPDC